jgi:hypothetical protein
VTCTDKFGPVLESLLLCASNALAACDVPASRVSLSPGATVAWDDCCDGGQLWVRVVSIAPAQTQDCGYTTLNMTVGVGIIRCVSVLDDNGGPPLPAELTADTLVSTLDASILLQAIVCCDLPGVNNRGIRVPTGTPLGVEGGCAGWEWTMTIPVF